MSRFAPRRPGVERRYAVLAAVYIGAIFGLSSLPDVSAPNASSLWSYASNVTHVPLFAGLAGLVLKSLPAHGGPRNRYVLAFASAASCAALDEWHQAFVPGRLVSASDWLLDVAGIAGALAVLRYKSGGMALQCEAE
jgi:VanZ family protein